MLRLLHIENIAIIEQCDIEFGEGFNVLTGETGAGKSIIIDSISAVLGERTTRELVRSGAERACVSALFDDIGEGALHWLSDHGFETENELLLKREITQDGKSSCRINGAPISVGLLKELGTLLLNIHGQRDSHALLNPESHAQFIDKFAENDEYIKNYENYTAQYERFCALREEQKKLSISEQEYLRRQDMLRYQIEELTAAELIPNELDELTSRRTMLRDASRITENLMLVRSLFTGDDERAGILTGLGGVERALYSINISEIQELSARMADLSANAADIAETISKLLDTIDASPEEIERVEQRFDLIKRLTAKYGATEEELIEELSKFKHELSNMEHSDERRAQIERELDECEDICWALAQKLFDARRAVAKSFGERVMNELHDLDMTKITFKVDVRPRESLTTRGADEIEFLISTNLGEPLKPLYKIASGGEMARIMLALKNVLAEKDEIKTLVFDEVDSGVSGRAAQRVAEKIAHLSNKAQVLCVTHLPQMSAMADVHFKITKEEKEGRTVTQVTTLEKSGRILELARIIGGMTITETTRENARELIETANDIKKELRGK